jgi:CheY-like chemotaxis protein
VRPQAALCQNRSVRVHDTREGTDGRARCLWRTRENGENTADMSERSGDAPRSNGPVLVVDDDPGLREIIRETLEDEGLLVDIARDGMQALELAAQRRPELVILDWGLPIIDGDVVAAQLRQAHGSSIRFLIVTADGRAAEKASRAGAFAYLHKPFDVNALVEAVRRGLDGS